MIGLDPRLLNRCLCAMMGNWPRLEADFIPIHAVFIWGRAEGEWRRSSFDDGVIKCAADLCLCHGCPVAIPGYFGHEHGQGNKGYVGPEAWRKALTSRHLRINDSKIIVVPGEGHNTKTEMDDCLQLAVSRGWKTIIGVTQPAHALRAMLGTVRSLQTLNLVSTVRVYPFWPVRFDFTADSYGSQGAGPYSRLDWIDQEYDRILRYQAQGDLASLEDLWSYITFLYQPLKPLA